MYLVLPSGKAPARNGPSRPLPFAFDRSELKQPYVQDYLRDVDHGNEVWCACRSNVLLPLATRLRAPHYYVARRGTSADDLRQSHAPHCYHANGDLGVSLGFQEGVIDRHGDDRLILDWDLLLNEKDLVASGDGGGGGESGERADHGPRLRKLLWLLLSRTGMNAYHPDLRRRRFFSSLYAETERIAIGRAGAVEGAMADRLLCTDWFEKHHKVLNDSKLTVVAPAKRKRVMVLCLLPSHRDITAVASSQKTIDLYRQVGAPVRLPVGALEVAFKACPEAQSWHEANGNVLLLGLVSAMPKKGSKAAFIGFVQGLALMPLHVRYVPVPSPKHVEMLTTAIARHEAFVVDAQEDPHLQSS